MSSIVVLARHPLAPSQPVARCLAFGLLAVATSSMLAADNRYHTDSDARYVHHIDLYDASNRKITPESTTPYSSVKTCGRCHDYETISHGWHFNAFEQDAAAGRQAEPWTWTDPRTGTQLPLSYRDWKHTYNPSKLGITPFEMTKQFGGRTPGGGMGDANQHAGEDTETAEPTRWPLSGSLEIDCMVCHAVSGAYDFNLRREQIAEENFAWAATAALRLGAVDGKVSRIKDGSDPKEEATQAKLPKVTYDSSRFGADGSVFMDLIRQPSNNACFQCHSNRTVSDSGIDASWVHDDDVHLRAGMACADCHRNGIDHHIVRGFDGEENPSQQKVATLSCSGCHLGTDHGADDQPSSDLVARAGRLGSPKPLHAGLPPLHFEKLSCTACHGGPVPRDEAVRIMTSLAHRLGDKGHRTGLELPAILGPVYSKQADGRVYPNRTMWPAFWGTMADGKVTPLAPQQSYDLTRKALRVRKDFVAELLQPKMSSSDLKEVLGEERAKTKQDEWTEEEAAKVAQAQAKKGRLTFNEKVSAALEAIEKEREGSQAVYVSSGIVYARGTEEGSLQTIDTDEDQATAMVSWPMAHNVRPAGWSLGVAGCTECHSDDAKIFSSTVAAIGPGPDQGEAVSMASLQGIDPDQRLAWNELFKGRKSFKYVIASSIGLLLMTLFVGIGAFASRFVGKTA
ncbi:MAG: hypothetical protein AB8B91_25685 [Rubripirellula sp.]